MGLFEQLQKTSARLGLTSKAVRALRYVSLLAFLAGIAWLLVLPVEGQFRNTYISENALLPAQAYTHFRESEWNIVRGYREEVRALEGVDEETRTQTLARWFDEIGLQVATQPWDAAFRGETSNGTNLYSILHAPRGGQTEAMVLVAPWTNQDGRFNEGGVALVLALARYFKRWSIWSKNLIFVVPSDSHYALRSWVQAYHTTLEATAGAIEGALVLDYPERSDYVDKVEISYEGLNGQLPNLDLVNSAVRIAEHEHLPVVVQGVHGGYAKYSDRLVTMLRGVLAQLLAGIRPGPGSENFSGWRIDAVTVHAIGTDGPMDITTFGRVAESVFRSINNLLEHFHQSFFFYLLLAPRKFVSIGTYLPAAMLVANSYSVMAIDMFLNTPRPTAHAFSMTVLLPLASNVAVFALCAVLGYVVLAVPDETTANGVMVSALALGLLVPVVARRYIRAVPRWLPFAYAVTMILHGLFLTTTAMLNFSLAMALGVLTLPLAWIRPGMPLRKGLALLVLGCPATGLFTLSALGDVPLPDLVRGLLWAWSGLHVWTWVAVAGFWLPVWSMSVVALTASGPLAVAPDQKNK